VRALVIFFICLAIASWTTYAAARFSAQYATQMEVVRLRVQYTDLEKRVSVNEHNILTARPSTVQVTTPTKLIEPAWYRNREATIDMEIMELRKRIADLEQKKKESQ
jgi:hypothetical protein